MCPVCEKLLGLSPAWKMLLPVFLREGSQRSKVCTLPEMQLRLTSTFWYFDDTAAAMHNAELREGVNLIYLYLHKYIHTIF